jgi:hydroxyethylthiazole kinase-like uncharacterized protein yjeF
VGKIATVEEMREIEKAADASGLSYARMMQNAGQAVADVVAAAAGDLAGLHIIVLCGSGNNGGDGLVAGELLAAKGAELGIYLVLPRADDDPLMDPLRQRGAKIVKAADDPKGKSLRALLEKADVLIDAVLGTGTHLPLKADVASVLERAGGYLEAMAGRVFVVAIDCPSGLDCNSGELAEQALQADVTVTMGAAKRGLLRFPGAEAVGELIVADIGFTDKLKPLKAIGWELADGQMVREWIPSRTAGSHKGTFGRVMIVAGSINYPGAALMAGTAAYRVGVGLVTLGVVADVQRLIAGRLPEATWIILPQDTGVIGENAAEILFKELPHVQALLLGPGFGLDPSTGHFLAKLLSAEESDSRAHIGFVRQAAGAEGEAHRLPPCVIDADGLKILKGIPDWPSHLPPSSILTPHPGEMSVLTGLPISEIQDDREGIAARHAASWGHVVVLKGAFTVVAEPAGRLVVIPVATSALARAGTGDVLAGTIAGLRAQGVGAFEAAVLGCYLHGRAGEMAAEKLGNAASVMAGDVANQLSDSLTDLFAGEP